MTGHNLRPDDISHWDASLFTMTDAPPDSILQDIICIMPVTKIPKTDSTVTTAPDGRGVNPLIEPRKPLIQEQ